MGKHKEKSKKHKKDKKKHRSRKSSSSSEEWVEKKADSSEDEKPSTSTKRDEWMSLSTSFLTESHLDKRQHREEQKRIEKEQEKYKPGESARELNPYWKEGGDGLPKFKKPSDDAKDTYETGNRYKPTSSWRKKSEVSIAKEEPKVESEALSDKELNVLASKLVKAEIMGNVELINELKKKLENARKGREYKPNEEAVILTQTDSKGYSRPLRQQAEYKDPWGGSKKKRKIDTHQDGQRVRYFPDDDQRSLQQMFENERFNTVQEQNAEFMKLAGRVNKNDDLEDIFADKISRKDGKLDEKNKDRAINEHQKINKTMDHCKLCLQSDFMQKHLMVSLGENAFLSVPAFEPMTDGHCLIAPIRHATASTVLDENEWEDIMNFRKALVRLFSSRQEDVIFFETARNFDKHPHMFIECVPVNREEGDLAPIYFKKAIDECEMEWAQNKKLVSLKNRDVRRAIPKGLPYFFVSFGMEEGYGHVIEDEKSFPQNFAQEIIGGMLDLHHSKWRKPKLQSFEEQSKRVVDFSKNFSEYDFTK